MEKKKTATKPVALSLVTESSRVEVLKEIEVPQKFFRRLQLGVQTLDEIFGGTDMPGILPGCTFLFTGMPGAGKSTMCLQLADLLQVHAGRSVLYNIGEESRHMIKIRANRIGLKQEFAISAFEQVDELLEYCEKTGVEVLFQDSIQSLRDGELYGPKLLKSVVKKIHRYAKDHDITPFLIGHITKGGQFAGPQEIKHDVDAHAHLKLNPETGNRIFELQKNRFGPACVPYEFMLSAQGLDFQALPSDPTDKVEVTGKAADRRDKIKTIIREALLKGEKISGYCFERLNADCSGGFWRGMLEKACHELESEGHEICEERINGRTHKFIAEKE